jgi:HEAT repeat protein
MTEMNIEDHKRSYFQALKPVAEDLRKAGLEIKRGDLTHLQAKNGSILSMKDIGIGQEEDDLQYLNRKYKSLPREAIEVLLKWIPTIDYPPAQEVLISQLSRTKVRYKGGILLDVFKNTDSSLVRERIGFVLEESNPEIDLQELENILSDPKYGQQTATLLMAGIKLLPKEKINPILIAKFNQLPLIALRGLKKTGGKDELEFLETQMSSGRLDKKQSKEVGKAIERIKNRIEV